METVAIIDALQVIAQLTPIVQAAIAKGETTISQADFDAAVGSRNAALSKLDTDIAAAITAARSAIKPV